MPFSNPGQPGMVKIDMLSGGISVIGYAGTEVDIEAKTRLKQVSEKKKSKKNTEGMFQIPVTSSALEVVEQGNIMRIDVESTKNTIDLTVKVPNNCSLKLGTNRNGEILVDNINGEIEVENHHGSIVIKDVSGSVIADTHHGSITVDLNSVDASKPMSFSTFHGDIDVTFPSTLKANVKLKSEDGDIFSDFKIVKQENPAKVVQEKSHKKNGKYQVRIEHAFYGSINGGGSNIQFNTYHGDIFIRKAK